MAEKMAGVFQPRGYQLEMLKMSMQRNIIVAMDTGSGKTLVGAMRIQAELERCPPHQRVWFLCPTVALADQQAKALARTLPEAFPIIVLSGSDGVDHWSSRKIWETVLDGISVVVCTYQVLLDALMHSFVLFDEIALLVFDEAHHCHGKHPANRILMNHYHPARRIGGALPHILGLTASPIQNTKQGGLEQIEASLNSLSRTPTDFREELLSHVYIPKLTCIPYDEERDIIFPVFQRLKQTYSLMAASLDKDPWVLFLKEQHSLYYRNKLMEAVHKGKTWSMEIVRRLISVSEELLAELGTWAAFRYLKLCVSRILEKRKDDITEDTALRKQELEHLTSHLAKLGIHEAEGPRRDDPEASSPKFRMLLDLISGEWRSDTTGIIFVKTRNAVKLLSTLFSDHPNTKHILRVGTFVGLSVHAARGTDLTELIDSKGQEETLDHLRSGVKNVLISTSVCEEGIDVSACNLVICFEAPANLRAFVQRRGRARSSSSKYIIMLAQDKLGKLGQWQFAEELMKQQYMDDMRQLKELERLESDEDGYRELVTPMGAKITLDDAVSTLQHFCSQIPKVAYTSQDPIYVFSPDTAEELSCTVILPNTLPPALRSFKNAGVWETQRLARRDAALEAMSAIYQAGLLNGNLMPLHHIDSDARAVQEEIEARPNMALVDDQYNPWHDITRNWNNSSDRYACQVRVSVSDGKIFETCLISSSQFPRIPQIPLFIDAETTATVEFTPAQPGMWHESDLGMARDATRLLLHAIVPQRVDKEKLDFIMLCTPSNVGDLQQWVARMSGTNPADTILNTQPSSEIGVVRDTSRYGVKYSYLGTEQVAYEPNRDSDASTDAYGAKRAGYDGAQSRATETATTRPMLKARKFPKRLDVLRPSTNATVLGKSENYTYVDPTVCTVDKLPAEWASFALWIPSLFHVVGLYMLAERLCSTLLRDISLDVKNVVEAISSGSAQTGSDYQRLEFLGDSLLSIQVSLAMAVEHPIWHEGYLSRGKAHEVSNGHLSRACIEKGLSKYILTKSFAGSKWRPPYVSDYPVDDSDERGMILERELSTKTLADVVEALLGAAWVSAGEPAMLKCLSTFIPRRDWKTATGYLHELRKVATEVYEAVHIRVPEHYTQKLSSLLGYRFTEPSLLLEAMTHPSYNTGIISTPSYQRLEFLGDSILESIVTERIFNREGTPIPVRRMHSIRAAAVNGHFLAFCALVHEIEVSRTVAHLDQTVVKAVVSGNKHRNMYDKDAAPVELRETTENLSLSSFLRVAPDATLRDALNATRLRFNQWKAQIAEKLQAGVQYPWTELSAFNSEKVFSDIVESTIAAIAIDQGYFGRLADGNPVQQCGVISWLERVGVIGWLDKMIENDTFVVLHPKEQIGILAVDRRVRYESWAAVVGADGRTLPLQPKPSLGKQDTASPDQSQTMHDAVRIDGYEREGETVFCYNIYVAEEKIASSTGSTRIEAETRAAERAAEILRKREAKTSALEEPALVSSETSIDGADEEAAPREDVFFDAKS